MLDRNICVAVLLTAMLALGCTSSRRNSPEGEAIAVILRLGGKMEFVGKPPDQRVLKVYLHGTAVQDADLVHLRQLSKLENLFLGKTRITDLGLASLGEATNLRTLSLNGTRVTDGGLKQLTHLGNLKTLNLQETKVTAAGVSELKRKLPGVTIAR